ncbi:MAG: hypothetical protein ACE5I7_18245 [Candidatus Binatia bacterium]
MRQQLTRRLVLGLLLLSLPGGVRAQQIHLDFSGFAEGTVVARQFANRGLLLASSGPAGPQVQVEPDRDAVLVPALRPPASDASVETIVLSFVDPQDDRAPATTRFVQVMTEVGPRNVATLEAYDSAGQRVATDAAGPSHGPTTLQVRADAIASARFTAMSNAGSRGCIGGISFAEPVPTDSP